MSEDLCFKFNEPTVKVMEDLKQYFGLEKKSEVLTKALTLLVVAVENEKQGGKILIEKEGIQTEISMNIPA